MAGYPLLSGEVGEPARLHRVNALQKLSGVLVSHQRLQRGAGQISRTHNL